MSDALQQRVVGIVDDSLAPLGFAIGGGMALRKHQIIDRLTKDVDTYSDVLGDGSLYDEAEQALTAQLVADGLEAETSMSDSFFRAIRVTDPVTKRPIRRVNRGERTRLHRWPRRRNVRGALERPRRIQALIPRRLSALQL